MNSAKNLATLVVRLILVSGGSSLWLICTSPERVLAGARPGNVGAAIRQEEPLYRGRRPCRRHPESHLLFLDDYAAQRNQIHYYWLPGVTSSCPGTSAGFLFYACTRSTPPFFIRVQTPGPGQAASTPAFTR